MNPFKIKSARSKRLNAFGLGNVFFTVGKINSQYQYIAVMWNFKLTRNLVLHKGSKSKFWNKYTLTIVSIVLNMLFPVLIPVILVILGLQMYYYGMINFIHNGMDITGVRFFTVATFVLLIILLIVK